MVSELQYNGYSASPSDYQSPDGELCAAMNVIPEKGGLSPILSPETIETFETGINVLLIHDVSVQENYILQAGDALYWASAETSSERTFLKDFSEFGGIAQVISVGNTLIALDCSGDSHYFLWKSNAYLYLGDSIPDLNVGARLRSNIINVTEFVRLYGLETDTFKTAVSGINTGYLEKLYNGNITSITLYDETQTTVYNSLFTLINRMQKKLREDNYFLYPFYVRFAYRLYDGTHTKHTVPILLAPSTWGKPFTSVYFSSETSATYDVQFVASRLTASIVASGLVNWKDIITAIDVYVTPSIIDYTDSAEAVKSLSLYPFKQRNDSGGYEYSEETPPKMMQEDSWEDYDKFFNKNISKELNIYSKSFVKGGAARWGGFSKKKYDYVFYAVDTSVSNITLVNNSGAVFSSISREDFKTRFPAAEALLPDDGKFVIYDFCYFRFVDLIATEGVGNTIYTIVGKELDESSGQKSWSAFEVALERIDTSTYETELLEYNQFYKIAEIPYSEIMKWKSYLDVPLKTRVLSVLETQPTLSDTGQGRVSYKSSFLQSYNNRLNVVVSKESYLPVNINLQNSCVSIDSTKNISSAFVEIYTNNQKVYARVEASQLPDKAYREPYIFSYPNLQANKLIMFLYGSDGDGTGTNYYKYEKELTRHPYLNLAYAFNSFETLQFDNVTTYESKDEFDAEIASIETHMTAVINNKIAVSQVSNPFLFPDENIIDLSAVSKVYALATAAQPLSEGQFGQFPLYAFTDEGVWALEVTSQGLYSARQPIVRDVCTNPDNITSLDNSVLFATKQGIIELAGSRTQCISDILVGDIFDISQLDYAYKRIITHGIENIVMIPFREFINNAQMIYDYSHQRVIVFNPVYKYAYILSLKSKQWGIMESDISSIVKNYPQAYAMTHGNHLVNYSTYGSQSTKGCFVTRPIKITGPNRYKTITSLIQRGVFKNGTLTTMLYGSRDLETWFPVYSSRDHYLRGMHGTAYKYFIIAATFDELKENEIIYGCSIEYDERLNNKLR